MSEIQELQFTCSRCGKKIDRLYFFEVSIEEWSIESDTECDKKPSYESYVLCEECKDVVVGVIRGQ